MPLSLSMPKDVAEWSMQAQHYSYVIQVKEIALGNKADGLLGSVLLWQPITEANNIDIKQPF